MSELSDLCLFFLAIAKCGLMTGLLPGGIFLAFFCPRAAKFFCPLAIGKEYRIVGYHTGDFVGEVEGVDRTFARVRVIDPMRPRPRVKDRCSFPECVRKDFHKGDHEFVRVREGALIEVSWESAKWIPVIEQVPGAAQLAKSNRDGMMPNPSYRATSPPRKEWRHA